MLKGATRRSTAYVVAISLVAALGGFLFGFDMIVVSGTIKSITAVFNLDSFALGWATSCCVFACIPGAAFAGKLADSFGRKRVLIGMTIIMGSASGQHGVLLITLILTYIAAYASSIACLTWVILSEIFPNRIRGEAMSVANLSLWTANSFLLLTFPIIQQRFGLAAPFAVYAAICLTIVAFVWKFIPETKGKSLEEIEKQLVGVSSQLADGALRIHAY